MRGCHKWHTRYSEQSKSQKTMKNNNNTNQEEIQRCISFLMSLGYRVSPPHGVIEDTMESVVQDWLAYKRERHQTYKPRGLASFRKRLDELSGGNVSKARAIVEQSMANNYAGIFPLKDIRNGESTTIRLASKAATILSD